MCCFKHNEKQQNIATVLWVTVYGNSICIISHIVVTAIDKRYHNYYISTTMVTRFSANMEMAHWCVVKWIFCYLVRTHELWLSYDKAQRTLVGYSDVDRSMSEDCCAIIGYTFLIDGRVMSWSSKKQEIVSLSMTESKYSMSQPPMT